MRKIYFLLLFLATISFQAFAQDYDSVIKEDSFWDVERGEEFCGIKSYTRYEIGSDTIINSFSYKKIRIYNFSGYFEAPCMVWDTPLKVLPNFSYTGEEVANEVFVREDIAIRKVYIRAYDENSNTYKEYTLYDFNLEANGIMENSYYFRGDDAIIASIDIDDNGKKDIIFKTLQVIIQKV